MPVTKNKQPAETIGRFSRQTLDVDLSVGLTLRTARLATKQTLQFYSRRLNIPVRYLRALEEESFVDLPGLVYEKHFISRYAEQFHLDGEALVAHWIAMRESEARPLAKFVPRVHKLDLLVSPLMGRRLVSASLFLVMAIYLGSKLWVMIEPPTLVLTNPQPDQIVQGAEVVVAGESAPSAIVKVNDQVVSTADGHFSVPLILDNGANTIKVVAERQFGRQTVVERRVFLAEKQALSKAGSTSANVLP
jgi:cytoskeletal protein RodZ